MSNEESDGSKQSTGNLNARLSFPERLFEMLLSEEHSDVVAWLNHGKAFRINKQTRFVNEVFPKYFKESKYTSFTRKLSRWGFSRVSKGPETGAYYHPMFQKYRKDLCSQIICGSVKLPKRSTEAINSTPEFTSNTADAFKLSQGLRDNTILIQELTKRVSDLSKTPMKQESYMPVSSENEANTSIDLSQSSIQSSINALQKRIKLDSISALQSNTQMLTSLAEQVQSTMQDVTAPNVDKNSENKSKRASAA